MRLAFPSILTVCAAAAAGLAPAAAASPALPAGADRPPVLPPGVIPAEAPVEASSGQAPSAPGRLVPLGADVARAAGATAAHPWATVNICDTENRPNNLGVRASMPGTGRRQLMFMRFTAQYWSPSHDAWLDVPGAGSSRWVYAGSARFATQQTGWTFAFDQPPTGTTFVMRAVVEQEWRGPDTMASAKRRAAKRTAAKRHAGKRHAAKRNAARHKARTRDTKPTHRSDRSPAKHTQQARRKAHKRAIRDAHKHRSRASAATKSHKSADPRAHWAIAKRETVLTKTGLEGVDGGDPAGTSKAMCLIW